MIILPASSSLDLAPLQRECEINSTLLIALLQYVQTIPGAPPLPAPLHSVAAALPSAEQVKSRIAAIDSAVAAGKTSASSLLHDSGFTWDEAHAEVKRWPALSGERKAALLQRVLVRSAMNSGE